MTNPGDLPLTDATGETYGTAEAYVHARYGVPPEELRELIKALAADEIVRALSGITARARYKS